MISQRDFARMSLDLALEPAPDGTNVQQAVRAIPNIHSLVAQCALDALKAEKWSWDVVAKKRVVEPDWKARLEAAKFLAAYGTGLPVQSVVNLNLGDSNRQAPDTAEAVRKSPALRAKLAALLGMSEKQVK